MALALFIRGLRFRNALLELDARLLRRSTSCVDGIRHLATLEVHGMTRGIDTVLYSLPSRPGLCCRRTL